MTCFEIVLGMIIYTLLCVAAYQADMQRCRRIIAGPNISRTQSALVAAAWPIGAIIIGTTIILADLAPEGFQKSKPTDGE